MLITDAITRIKNSGHDISNEYSNARCIEFLNTSIQQIYGLMIRFGYPPVVKEITLHDDDSLPRNYMKSCGSYPIRITNNIVKLVDGESVRFRYFASPTNLSATDTSLPFDHDAINECIVRGAVILALNENEYDLSQDSSLLNALQQAIAGGMGAGT